MSILAIMMKLQTKKAPSLNKYIYIYCTEPRTSDVLGSVLGNQIKKEIGQGQNQNLPQAEK